MFHGAKCICLGTKYHEYFGIDYEIIWDIAVNYLPENKVQLEEVLRAEK